MSVKKFLSALRRAANWHRRKLAVVVAFVATAVILTSLPPPGADLEWAVVVTRELRAGTTVQSPDVNLVQLPREVLPESAITDVDQVVGRFVIATLPRRSILTTASVFTPGHLGAPPGMAILPVRLQDKALYALLQVGAVVDLIGFNSRTGKSEVLAQAARIAAIPAREENSGFGQTGESGLLILVEVRAAAATDLSTAALTSQLNVVLR